MSASTVPGAKIGQSSLPEPSAVGRASNHDPRARGEAYAPVCGSRLFRIKSSFRSCNDRGHNHRRRHLLQRGQTRPSPANPPPRRLAIAADKIAGVADPYRDLARSSPRNQVIPSLRIALTELVP